MLLKKEKITVQGSKDYAALSLYLLEDSKELLMKKRPIVLICPGGGYEMTSDREAEPVAMQFLSMGYHAAVLRYSVAPAIFPTALEELAASVGLIREHAKEWNIAENQVVVAGFSAGGHLAASYGMFWSKPWVNKEAGRALEEYCPNAMILGYPVITSGEYAHVGSFQNLLGEDYEEKKEALSLENCVNDQMPRTFVWHTYEDDCVKVQNSLLLVNELVKQKIPTEFHMFEKGGHGLSLANRVTQNPEGYGIDISCKYWTDLVHNWLERWILEEQEG